MDLKIDLRSKAIGTIPGVIYSKGYNVSVELPEKFFTKIDKNILYTVFKLEINGETILAMFKTFQVHAVTNKVIHFDMIRLFPGQNIIVNARVSSIGKPKDLANGLAVLSIKNKKVPIICTLENIIPEIVCDISNLNKHESISSKDFPEIKFQKPVTLVSLI